MLTPVPTEMARLVEWLLCAIARLETDQAQIVLNIDREIVAWEIKTVTHHSDASGGQERVERRKSGRLRIKRSVPTE